MEHPAEEESEEKGRNEDGERISEDSAGQGDKEDKEEGAGETDVRDVDDEEESSDETPATPFSPSVKKARRITRGKSESSEKGEKRGGKEVEATTLKRRLAPPRRSTRLGLRKTPEKRFPPSPCPSLIYAAELDWKPILATPSHLLALRCHSQ